MSEPRWLTLARTQIGVREIKGPAHNPLIVEYWRAIKRGGIKTDEVPWCAAFVGAMLERSGIQSTRFESAKSFETWGTQLAAPVVGCIVVFSRAGGGHVGFVVGQDSEGSILVLGGNQSDEVNIRAFSRARATAYRWPSGEPVPSLSIPIIAAGAPTSEKEA